MTSYEFVLHFSLAAPTSDPESYLDALFEAGCDDAMVGVGLPGSIALDFCREADSAETAIKTAFADVLQAIPGAKLTEIGPDLMNVSELAAVITQRVGKVTRQAVRKYTQNQVARTKSRFPPAVITGSSPLWHASEVLDWMVYNEKLTIEATQPLIDTARTARAINAVLQREKDPRLMAMAEELVAHA